MKGKIVLREVEKQRRKQQERDVVMANHRGNATATTAARTDVSRRTANDITLDTACGWSAKRAMLVLGPGRAIYVGMGQSSALHRHYATQISIGLGAPLQVRTRASGPYTERQSFVVGPHIPHQVEMTGVPSFVLWSETRA